MRTFAHIAGFLSAETRFARAGRSINFGLARFVGFQTSIGIADNTSVDPADMRKSFKFMNSKKKTFQMFKYLSGVVDGLLMSAGVGRFTTGGFG